MKPLNLDNSPCSPTSSNCIIWQGPSIPCIKLCTGDTVTDVVYQLALKLCEIMDQVNISALDLTCLKITTGTPNNINELLQILIDKICAANNIPAPSTGTSSTCPTNCIVDVAECLRVNNQPTMKLLDYVQLIGNRICSLVSQITTINSSITNLDNRVTELESVPPPTPYILPGFAPTCTLSSSVAADIERPINFILEALVNDEINGYCALLTSTGKPFEIIEAYNLGNTNVNGTMKALSNCSLTLQQLFSSTWTNTPLNLSDSFSNLWLAVKDLRDAYKTYSVTAGNSNVTVTSSTVVGSCGPEKEFAVKAKSASVIAGTNITSVTSNVVGDNTEYTVNAKGITVEGGDNTTVDVNTTNPANTIYTVNAALDTFVATTIINSTRQPLNGTFPIQTPGSGISIGSTDMKILRQYNIVTVNNVTTDAGLTAGAYVTSVTTLPFGTFSNYNGWVEIEKTGTYLISGYLQLKGATLDPPIWQTAGIGSFHLGIITDTDNVFSGNSQHVQGPIPSLGILGQHTTITLTSSVQVPITAGTYVRLGVFNFTDRAYNGNTYTSSDIIRFSITRLN
jgi:hypothetical protein